MDATAKKIVSMLMDSHREIERLRRSMRPLKETLESIGMRSSAFNNLWDGEGLGRDGEYAEKLLFANMTLVDTCKCILWDLSTEPLSKSNIEYLATMGGYPFTTNNSKNSVDVTMRRLAKDGFCEIHRRQGSTENWYCLTEEQFKEASRSIRKEFVEIVEKSRRKGLTDAGCTNVDVQ